MVDQNGNPDPDRKWRRTWRALHSPLVLLPSCVVCIAAATGDITEAVPRFGWLSGAILATLLVCGIFVSILDLVPHMVRWLRRLHAGASNLLLRSGLRLERLSSRIKSIIDDS